MSDPQSPDPSAGNGTGDGPQASAPYGPQASAPYGPQAPPPYGPPAPAPQQPAPWMTPTPAATRTAPRSRGAVVAVASSLAVALVAVTVAVVAVTRSDSEPANAEAGSSASRSAEQSTERTTTTKSAAPSTRTTPRPTRTPTPPPPPPLGSAAAPIPLGQAALVGDYRVTITGVDTNADAAIAAANMFNDPPTGRYMLVDITATYTGGTEGHPGFELSAVYNGTDARQYSDTDCGQVTPNPSLDAPRLNPGGTASFQFCMDVPPLAIDGGVLFVEPRYSSPSDRVYYAAR